MLAKWYPVRCEKCGRQTEVLGKTTTMLHAKCPKRRPGDRAPRYLPDQHREQPATCVTCKGRGGFFPVGDCEGPPPEWKPCPDCTPEGGLS